MKGYLVFLALFALSAGAPQNWPYRDSLMPYHRYGLPQAGSQYKYLPQIEDDEDVGPYGQGRQDAVVGSDGLRPIPTNAPTGVVETGSVAPVVDPVPAKNPPPPKPVSGVNSGPKPVQPPPFPPARPPPTPPPKEDEEDEEDDEDSDEVDDEDGPPQEEQDEEQDNDDEDDDDDDRKRQESLSDEKPEVPSVPEVQTPPAPVVTKPVVTKPTKPVAPVVEVNKTAETSVESNEVTKPNEVQEENSSEEQDLDDGVEALVPGYVTDQGEVLVPVDTVTGDAPISIVPDPYAAPQRGIQIGEGVSNNFRYIPGYPNSNPYFYSDVYENEQLGRQDDSEDDDGEDDDEEEGDDEEDGERGRNEYLTSFPPSRTPELYAVINSRYGSDDYMAYKQQPMRVHPSVSVAVALNGNNGMPNKVYEQQPAVYKHQHMHPAYPFLKSQQSPYYSRPQQGPYVNRYVTQNHFGNRYVTQNPYVNRYQQYPYGEPGYFSQTRFPYYESPMYRPVSGYRPRRPVAYRPRPSPYTQSSNNKRPGFKPVVIALSKRPSGPNENKKVKPVKTTLYKNPTPVEHQDDFYPYEPLPYQTHHAHAHQHMHMQTQGSDETYEEQKVEKVSPGTRSAKKMEKKGKKNGTSKKPSDPLNILKKISPKKNN